MHCKDEASQDNGKSSLTFDNAKLTNVHKLHNMAKYSPRVGIACLVGVGGYVAMLVAGSLGSSRLVL